MLYWRDFKHLHITHITLWEVEVWLCDWILSLQSDCVNRCEGHSGLNFFDSAPKNWMKRREVYWHVYWVLAERHDHVQICCPDSFCKSSASFAANSCSMLAQSFRHGKFTNSKNSKCHPPLHDPVSSFLKKCSCSNTFPLFSKTLSAVAGKLLSRAKFHVERSTASMFRDLRLNYTNYFLGQSVK